MDKAEVIQVIRTTLTRRGDGKDDPIRVITQYWTLDGELLAEVDPMAGDTATARQVMADAISGDLGRRVGLGFRTPGYAGNTARY